MCMVFAPNSHLLYVASANAWKRQQKLSLFRIDIYYYYYYYAGVYIYS